MTQIRAYVVNDCFCVLNRTITKTDRQIWNITLTGVKQSVHGRRVKQSTSGINFYAGDRVEKRSRQSFPSRVVRSCRGHSTIKWHVKGRPTVCFAGIRNISMRYCRCDVRLGSMVFTAQNDSLWDQMDWIVLSARGQLKPQPRSEPRAGV